MNYLDIFFVVPMIWGGFIGYKKGLIIEVVTLIALGLGIYGGIHFSDYIAELLITKIDSEYLPLVSFALTFIIIVVGVYFIGKMLEKIVNMVQLKLLNKLAGVVFGISKVTLIISVLVLIANSYDQKDQFIPTETKKKSLLFTPLSKLPLQLMPTIQGNHLYDEIINSEQ